MYPTHRGGNTALPAAPAGVVPRVLLALGERPDLGEIVRQLQALRVLPFVALSFRHTLSLLRAIRLDMLVLDGRMLVNAEDDPAVWRALIDKVAVVGPAADWLPTDVDVLDAAVSCLELSLRVRESLSDRGWGILRQGGLEIDLRRREAHWMDQRLLISPVQLRLLATLVEANGAVVSKADLAWRLFGNISDRDERVETHVRRIRRCLARFEGGRGVLLTVRGEGYRLDGLGGDR
ncbi:MAG TPA: winged helix-turn-helix domain-containing protein [Micromonosporaceae bacterium]